MGRWRHTPMILPRCSRQSWTPPCFASVVTRQTWPSQRTFPRSFLPSTRAALLATPAISNTVPPSSRLREAANDYHSPSTAHSVACCRGCLEEHPGGNTRGFTQLQHDGALVGHVGGLCSRTSTIPARRCSTFRLIFLIRGSRNSWRRPRSAFGSYWRLRGDGRS